MHNEKKWDWCFCTFLGSIQYTIKLIAAFSVQPDVDFINILTDINTMILGMINKLSLPSASHKDSGDPLVPLLSI